MDGDGLGFGRDRVEASCSGNSGGCSAVSELDRCSVTVTQADKYRLFTGRRKLTCRAVWMIRLPSLYLICYPFVRLHAKPRVTCIGQFIGRGGISRFSIYKLHMIYRER